MFWFEQALNVSFRINDCIVHALNYLYRHPVFVKREQVYQLALARSKKAKDYVIEQKIKQGYPLVMFDNFVVKGHKSYVTSFHSKYSDNVDEPAWQQLKKRII